MPSKKPTKVDNAFVISQYYGFGELNLGPIDKEPHEKAQKIRTLKKYNHSHLPKIEELVATLYHANTAEEKRQHLPISYYTKGELKNPQDKKPTRKSGETISLHIVGTTKSIAEAILIKTAYTILKEEGYKNLSVEINNVGDKESLTLFNKHATNFFRGKLPDLNKDCKELLKFGGHALMACNIKGVQHLLKEAPTPLDFLNEENRIHFKEVIEYIDSQNIPFEINKFIFGDPQYSSHTIFTIIDSKSNKILATGSRFDEVSKKTIVRKGIPGVSVSIKLPKLKQVPASKVPNFDTCDIFFLQLGYGAKLKSLEVVEILRKAGICVHQSIGRDKMATQTQFAHKKGVKYMLLMGQKEASEDSICVRHLETNSQQTIPLTLLVEHLSNLKKAEKKNSKKKN